MRISKITAKGVHDAPQYAQAYKLTGVSDLIFTSGQVALTEAGEPCHLGDFRAQAQLVLATVKRLIEAGGSSIDRIVKLTVFLTDARYRPEFAQIRDDFFNNKVPPISIIEVGALMRPEWMIEVEAIAAA